MAGNVWEWCLNKYHDPTDNSINQSNDYRVLRGGSWYDYAFSLRSADRLWYSPDYRLHDFGFRVVYCPPSDAAH